MSYENWKDQAPNFQVVDVRHLQGNFFPGLKQKAMGLEVGEGFTVIQTFEPHPLYAAMEALGFEHHTEQAGPAEFHVSFCRVEKKDGGEDTPFKPLALLNYPMIDEELGRIAADFWSLTWQSEKRTLPYEMRLLLSLANAVEERLRGVKKPIKVAVMGCAVNGPGEAREADIGVAGGDGCGVLFKKGEILRKVPEDRILEELFAEIEKM